MSEIGFDDEQLDPITHKHEHLALRGGEPAVLYATGRLVIEDLLETGEGEDEPLYTIVYAVKVSKVEPPPGGLADTFQPYVVLAARYNGHAWEWTPPGDSFTKRMVARRLFKEDPDPTERWYYLVLGEHAIKEAKIWLAEAQ